MKWPALPVQGFIAARPATVDDVDQGRAVFCQQSDDRVTSQPYPIAVPQYAIWHKEDGADVPAILVQAERHINVLDGEAVFGLRTLDGRELVADSSEVSLLGEQIPTSD